MLWDMNGELKRMSSLAGIVLLLLLGFVFSKNRNRVLPSLCYMAALLRILYYVGFMQACLGNIHHYVNVGPSFNSYEVLIALLSAVNGPVESMLLVHPYLLTMSRSSLHCILTLDCGTVSGRLMPVYVDLGVNSTYLLSATILSVPAALAYSKLVYPETDENSQLILEYHSPERNLIEAFITGAMIGVYLMLAVAGNMLTYASAARFFDALVAWTANNVGVDELTLQVISVVDIAWRLFFFYSLTFHQCCSMLHR
ncbi:sodium/nucleoside cotransporter 1-like isoform X4 [Dermacentor andersoni]|uniref:sodium/nucleoside cotransporter 1-like isoform X4 n=1 Tax=Dermacentor andersoni TaxID=34620 RepID=UPI002417F6AA|nr:solute carrier family 28 member 3-like isoform X4 [Dermacentor andersoni]